MESDNRFWENVSCIILASSRHTLAALLSGEDTTEAVNCNQDSDVPKLLDGGFFHVTVRGEGGFPWQRAAGLTEDLPGLLATNDIAAVINKYFCHFHFRSYILTVASDEISMITNKIIWKIRYQS